MAIPISLQYFFPQISNWKIVFFTQIFYDCSIKIFLGGVLFICHAHLRRR